MYLVWHKNALKIGGNQNAQKTGGTNWG